MAENEPTEVHPKVEPVTQDSTTVSTRSEKLESENPVDQAPTDGATNPSHVQEPKEGASASDPSATSNSVSTGDDAVATVSGQVTNPGPPDDASRSESQALNPAPATETTASAGTTLATPTPTKRFTSMNINKKFLAKTAAGTPSSSTSPAAPKASTSTSPVQLWPTLSHLHV
ncbi:hypothetical protein B0J17DRAFT_314004 [Rhizoctonia solani]|nr:hypothetical protein B0J17DRAFT_314004 [Rhizoctonia solani]